MTDLFSQICMRLRVPATPNELAVTLDAPVKIVRGSLYQLRKQGRVVRTNRCKKTTPGVGRKEYFWMALS